MNTNYVGYYFELSLLFSITLLIITQTKYINPNMKPTELNVQKTNTNNMKVYKGENYTINTKIKPTFYNSISQMEPLLPYTRWFVLAEKYISYYIFFLTYNN